MKHSEYLCTNFAFGHLAPTYELGAMIFQSDLSFLYIRMVARHLVWRAWRNFVINMANVIEEMVDTREAEAAAVATESGGAVATESGGAMATESGGAVATESGGRW